LHVNPQLSAHNAISGLTSTGADQIIWMMLADEHDGILQNDRRSAGGKLTEVQ
jgi:hypothetical protein